MRHSLKLNLLCLALSFYFFLTSFAAVDTIPSVKLSSLRRDTIPGKDTAAFKKVDKEAYFIGGEKAWARFIAENVNPNVPVKKKAPAGNYTVIIQFIVNKDGTLDIEPLTNLGYGMEDEVIRVIKKSPLWIPAEQDGKKVRAYRKQPITFNVEDNKRRRSKE